MLFALREKGRVVKISLKGVINDCSYFLISKGIFKDLGIIKRNHLVEVQRSDLVAKYIGATAQKTEIEIKEAEGGVLFVDEAYRLCSDSEKDFGKESIVITACYMLLMLNKKICAPYKN